MGTRTIDPLRLADIYDRAAFEQDAARNARGNAEVLYGVTILCVREDGHVDIRRTAQQIAERDPEGDSIFVPAYRSYAASATDGGAYQGSLVPPDEAPDSAGDYERFLEGLADAARNARFKRPIGEGDDRLKGFRGG